MSGLLYTSSWQILWTATDSFSVAACGQNFVEDS
jgi:hypothetical protein